MEHVTTAAPAAQVQPLATPAVPQFDAERAALAALQAQPAPLNERQCRAVLEQMAGRAATLNDLLMAVQDEPGIAGTHAGVLLDAAQVLAEVLGAMADDATGNVVVGDMRRWLYGPNFSASS